MFVASKDQGVAIIFSRLTYYLGTIIGASFLYFFITYPEDKKPKNILTILLIINEILLAYIFIFTNNIINGVFPLKNLDQLGWQFGKLSFIFEIFFIGYFIAGLIILYRKYYSCINPKIRINLGYMFWAMIIGIIPPSVICIILPRFGYFDLNWLGPVTEIIWIPVIAYSIIKYRQMNVRTVVTEVLAVGMTVIFFINIFIDLSLGIGGRVITFIVFLILAFYLFKVSLQEAEQNDQLTSLNATLSERVAEKTKEVRQAYEIEKKARWELEKLNETKDQFVMIAEHHLRMPLASIHRRLEMISEKVGADREEIQEVLRDTSDSVDILANTISSLSGIAVLKPGQNILNLSRTNIKTIVEDVIKELKFYIKDLHISITYPKDKESWPELHIDKDKIYEVILIIMENSIKYNHDHGTINISTKSDANNFELTIENTGIGITEEEKETISKQVFYRSEKAKKLNPLGMGVGLSVARTILNAHHGSLEIESGGRDMGARICIVLKLL
jgi:signal transduction histidine kinase